MAPESTSGNVSSTSGTFEVTSTTSDVVGGGGDDPSRSGQSGGGGSRVSDGRVERRGSTQLALAGWPTVADDV